MKREKKQKQVQPKEESLSYALEVRDKEGRVIQHISAPSRSYVQQWNQLLNVKTAYASRVVKDTGGTNRDASETSASLINAAAAIANTDYGLRVGKGTTAVAITDYALENPCAEGIGVDQFNHQAVTFTDPSVVAVTCSFTVKRIFLNNSGATISGIKEIGCYVLFKGDGVGNCYGMVFRDVLPSLVTVPHGGSITVTYTLKVTV